MHCENLNECESGDANCDETSSVCIDKIVHEDDGATFICECDVGLVLKTFMQKLIVFAWYLNIKGPVKLGVKVKPIVIWKNSRRVNQ